MFHFRALFGGLGSMQILGFSFGFCTDTMPLIQSVLQSTGAIISLSTRLCNSSHRGFIIATGTLRFGSFKGSTVESISILYSPSKHPSPVNTSLNSVFISSKVHVDSLVSVVETILSMDMFSYCTFMSFIASLAFLPSRGVLQSSHTT